MSLMHFSLLLFAGIVAGVSAGLLGIGGGLVLVPVLTWLLVDLGVELKLAVTMAVATSLAAILFTAVSSVVAHHRRGAVDWPVVLRMGPMIGLGAVLGGVLADYIGGIWLARMFALFAMVVALRTWVGWKPLGQEQVTYTWARTLAVVMGAISSMVGIGGGSLTVPYLSWRGMAMVRAVATGSGLGYPIALAGAGAYIILGWRQAIEVPHWGYIYWPGMMVIVLTSVMSAPWGAALAHRWPPRRVARIFALLLALMAARMAYQAS